VRWVLGGKGIAFKLGLAITLIGALIFVAVFSSYYYLTADMMKSHIESDAMSRLNESVNRVESVLKPVMKVPENAATILEQIPVDKEAIRKYVQFIVKSNPEIIGTAVAFMPDRDTAPFMARFYRDGKSIVGAGSSPSDASYTSKEWFSAPMRLGRPVWSEPYMSDRQKLMATYSVPFYRMSPKGETTLSGVVTADISLEWLRDIVSSIHFLKTGYGALISKNGTYVTHPDKRLIMSETIFKMAEKTGNPELRQLGKHMLSGETGYYRMTTIYGKFSWVFYKPIPANEWVLGIAFPEDEILANVRRLSLIILALCFVGFGALLAAVVITARSITRPLSTMTSAVKEIAGGNIYAELPEAKTRDEVGALTASFGIMQEAIKQYINDLEHAVATKQRLESELTIARDIQMTGLRKEFPPFPDRTDFDIYAMITSAREVGGDLYDFFLADDHTLCFVIGDSSGKGVPAALHMAAARILVRALTDSAIRASSGIEPGAIMGGINRELSRDNVSGMFVTMIFGTLDTATGELRYVNAGHNYPFVIRGDGSVDVLATKSEIVAGAVEDFDYTTHSVTLNGDDAIFLYTDGVTEAMNGKQELYGMANLKQCLTETAGIPPRETIEILKGSLTQFSGPEPQSDDITMLMIRRRA
jgi:sigma-B regulation protein RsbU (phosphoserine phosphatase)